MDLIYRGKHNFRIMTAASMGIESSFRLSAGESSACLLYAKVDPTKLATVLNIQLCSTLAKLIQVCGVGQQKWNECLPIIIIAS